MVWRVYEHPTTGKQQDVGSGDIFWTFFIGPIYPCFRQAYAFALLWFISALPLGYALSFAGAMAFPPLALIGPLGAQYVYARYAPRVFEARMIKDGWKLLP